MRARPSIWSSRWKRRRCRPPFGRRWRPSGQEPPSVGGIASLCGRMTTATNYGFGSRLCENSEGIRGAPNFRGLWPSGARKIEKTFDLCARRSLSFRTPSVGCGPNDLLWLCGQTALPCPFRALLFSAGRRFALTSSAALGPGLRQEPETRFSAKHRGNRVACWRFIPMSLGPPGAGSRRGCSGGAKAIARQEKRRSPSTVPASNLAGQSALRVLTAPRLTQSHPGR
jgi:hypothetical protein